MDIKLRIEQSSDYHETENITREAFWNHYSPGCDEHYLLHIMRNHPKFVPELDIVAEHNNKIVGNVVCLKSFIMADDGNQYEVLSLGPISVLPEYQQKLVSLLQNLLPVWNILLYLHLLNYALLYLIRSVPHSILSFQYSNQKMLMAYFIPPYDNLFSKSASISSIVVIYLEFAV